MQRLVGSLGVLALISLIAPPLRAASFTPLGNLSNANPGTWVYDISSDGSAVAGYGGSASGRGYEALRWDAVHGMQGLGDPGAIGFQTQGLAISGDGSTVAGYRFVASDREAFRWDATHGLQAIGDLAGGGLWSEAKGVSADGSVVVGMGWSAAGFEAFRWDATTGMQGLGDLPGAGFNSVAWGVSADGSVIAGIGLTAVYNEAFIWDAVQGMRGLGYLPGGDASEGLGISADGTTVIGASRYASGSGFEAFRWSANHGMQGLGDLPGGLTYSVAWATSGDGSVVVGRGQIASGSEAFIWDAQNGMRELRVVLTNLGLDLQGWRLHEALSISADGRTIIGNGSNSRGGSGAWIAVIPEPSTALLIALGLTALGLRSRRDIPAPRH